MKFLIKGKVFFFLQYTEHILKSAAEEENL